MRNKTKILLAVISIIFLTAKAIAQEKPEVYVQLGHRGSVNSVSFSPDGKVLASGSNDNTIKLWDVVSGKLIRSINAHSDVVNTVAFSSDGKIMASGSGEVFGLKEASIKLWDVSSGKFIKELGTTVLDRHRSKITSVAFSSDGKYLVSASLDKSIRLWDISTGKVLKILAVDKPETEINVIALSKDGKFLAAGLKGNSYFDYSKNSQITEKTIKVWDVLNEKLIWESNAVDSRVISVTFSPDGKYLVSGEFKSGYDRVEGKVKLWGAISGRLLKTIDQNNYYYVNFSSDGKQLLIGNSETLELWELESEKIIKRFNVQGLKISSISFSLDREYVAAGSYDGSIRMWGVEREEEIWTNNPHQRSIESVIASPKGNFIAIGSGEYNLDKKTGVINLIEISTGKLKKRININGEIPVSIAFSPDERYIANITFNVGGKEVVEIRDIKTSNLFRRIASSRPLSICFSHNGKILALGSEDKTIKLWDVSSGKLIKKLSGHTSKVTSLSFSSDGRYLASGSADNYFKLWEVNTGKILWSIFSPGAHNNIVAFSPNDKYVALASKPAGLISEENLMILIEASTGKIIRSFDDHLYGVNSISFSSDGNLIASGNDDKTIKISDVSTGEIIRVLEGHQLPVTSVNFLPIHNKKYLVSSSEDGEVRLWNVETGKEIAMFVSFKDGEWITITPEGYYDASANGDKYLNVRIGNKVYGIENYRETFFRPDLVKSALAGIELKDFKTLADIKLPPQVEILNALTSAQQDEIDITVKLTDQGGGIGDVRLYLNETAVLVDGARGMKKISQEKTQTRSYRIKMVNGANVIKAIVFNADNTMQSNAAIHTVVANLGIKKPKMYVLAIGINEFKNPKLELQYAVADAKLFVEALKESAKELFEKIEVKLLTTKEETTKESIKAALEGMRGISPEDVFVFYVASHGIAEEGEYFLLTSNVGSVSTNRLREDALTQTELKELIANVSSTKKFIALDACHSGKLGEELQVAMLARTRGMSEETAVKILSRAVGSMILSASTTQQEALEGYEGHGLFTYVLAEGIKGNADKDKDGIIRTIELADYVDLRVPELAEKVFKRAQYPTATPSGQAFPIGKAK